jgi:hypothetical protein
VPAPVGYLWDPRAACHRAPAIAYAELVRALTRDKVAHDDQARAYPTLEHGIRVRREPRPYQTEALAAWQAQRSRGVVVLPTGAGKSQLACMAIDAKRRAALVVAPTLDLVSEAALDAELPAVLYSTSARCPRRRSSSASTRSPRFVFRASAGPPGPDHPGRPNHSSLGLARRAVLGIYTPFAELIPFVPMYVQAVLIPFRDVIITDGFLESPPMQISFGGGARRIFQAQYSAARTTSQIRTALPWQADPNPGIIAARKKTPRKPSRSRTPRRSGPLR